MILSGWWDFDRSMREVWKATKEEDVDTIRDKIQRAIAMSTTSTQFEVDNAYERLGSWDDVIAAAYKTLEGYSMACCVDDILIERELLAEKLVCDKMAAAGISGAKAGKSLRKTIRMIELFKLICEDE